MPAFVDFNSPAQIAVYRPTDPRTLTAPTLTSTSTSQFHSATISAATVGPSSGSHGNSKVAAIAGGIAGGLFLALLGFLFIFLLHKRKKQLQNLQSNQLDSTLSGPPAITTAWQKQGLPDHESYLGTPSPNTLLNSPSDQSHVRYSELEGDAVQISELETPLQSPNLLSAASENANWSMPAERA